VYIAHLWKSGLKTTTIRSNLSAISFIHKINRHPDPCNSYYLKQILRGSEKTSGISSSKLQPISKPLLHNMLNAIPYIIFNPYDKTLFKCLLVMSYYCCLRAGEAVISNCSTHTIKYEQIHVQTSNSETVITIEFQSYKHCNNPTTKFILRKINSDFCPVNCVLEYLAIRPPVSGPFFVFGNCKPVKRTNLSSIIKNCMSHLQLDPRQYNTHSLRIGRATDLALCGTSHETIKQTGRWASTAYLRYIRLTTFDLPCV